MLHSTKRIVSSLSKALPRRSLSSPSGADFAASVAPMLVKHLREGAELPVVKLRSPSELQAAFKALGVPLPLADGEAAVKHANLLEACGATLEYSVNTASPLFNNQLYGTADPVGIAGDWLVAVLNANAHTFEVAPVFTAVENELMLKMGRVLGGGYAAAPPNGSGVEGLFVPGGSLSNMYALSMARYRHCPDVKTKGNGACPDLVAFTSDESHYSYKKSCSLLGLGSDNLVAVRTDAKGAMDPAALSEAMQAAVEQGRVPFFVGATAGSTVLGAFDPFNELSDVVEAFNDKQEPGSQKGDPSVWLHVDGAWGGAAVLSPGQRHLCAGVERADSFCWNPHKAVGAPLQCAQFLSRHPGLLQASNGTNAAYLFQPDKENTEMDMGDKTFQCGRKVDSFKLWLMWKALGDQGLAKRVDHLALLAHYMHARLRDYRDDSGRRCFVPLFEVSFTNVVFYLLPPSQRVDNPSKTSTLTQSDPSAASKSQFSDLTLGLIEKEANEAERAALSPESLNLEALKSVAPVVKARLQNAGLAMIGFQPVKAFPNCWRMVFAGAKEDEMTEATVDKILDDLVAHAKDL